MTEEVDDVVEIPWELPQAPPPPVPHMEPAGDPVVSELFRDPVAEKKRRMNMAGDQRIIRDINEITLPDDGALDDSIDALLKCRFDVPSDFAEAKLLMQELRTVSAVWRRLDCELQAPDGGELTRTQKQAILLARGRLMHALYVNPTTFVSESHRFTEQWVDKTLRVDILMFFAILQCCDLAGRGAATEAQLSQFSPKSPQLAGLVRQKVFHPSLLNQPFLNLTVPELIVSVNFLESRWNYIDFVPLELRRLLDLLLARVAAVATKRQPLTLFGDLDKYRLKLTDTHCKITTEFLEDFCWSLLPMFKKLTWCEKIMKFGAPLPFVISDTDAAGLEEAITENTMKMKNSSLQTKYFTAYTNAFLRPSEVRRYRRDFPGGVAAGSAIIEKMRGTPAKNTLMEKLAAAPWELTRAKLLQRYEIDLMYVMMLDVRVNNISNRFNWMATMVYFNVHLLEEPDVVKSLIHRKPFPRLVQAFNGFGVFHQEKYYVHNSAAKAFLHWLCIMLGAEFKGLWEKHNFNGLHTMIPDSLKKLAGLSLASQT